MTMTSAAKFSAIYMLAVVLAGTASAFWPAGNDGGAGTGRGSSTPHFILD